MPAAEPTLEVLHDHPWLSGVLATRPPFLLASAVPVGLGWATVMHAGVPVVGWALLACLACAVLAHAGINVLNDYYDALNGTDACNAERLFPFTGGSRFIQNGVHTLAVTFRLGMACLGLAALLGFVLMLRLPAPAWPGVLVIGGLGLLIGWAYSAPPLALNSRGWGECAVGLGFGVLIPLGADYALRGALAGLPLWAGVSYGLLVTNLLFINQFPDWRADQIAGKRHWVVRLGPDRAKRVYAGIALAAYLWLLVMVLAGCLPLLALTGMAPLPLSAWAAWQLWQHALQPSRLAPAIQATIGTMVLHGLMVSIAMAWS